MTSETRPNHITKDWRGWALRAAFAAAAVLLAWAYLVALRAPAVGTFHDDGIYAVTARALAEGRGYRILSLPDAPPQTKYPILFPWLLSLIWRLAPGFPENLPWLRAVPLLSTVAWLWLSWRLVQQCGGSRRTATTIVLVTALSPWTLFLATALLSETLFAALLTAALLVLTATPASIGESRRLCALAGLLSAASLLTRAAGVAVVAAGLGWLLSRRRWSDAAVFAIVAGVVVAPWGWWVAMQNQVVGESYYSATPYGTWNIVSSYSWPEKVQVLLGNVVFSAAAPATLWGIGLNAIVIGVCLATVVPAVIRGLWLTRANPLGWCVAVVIAMNVMWVWPPQRFIVPIVPLVLWQVSVALRGAPQVVVVALVASLGVCGAWRTVEVVRKAQWAGAVAPWAASAEDWRQLVPLLDWVKRETPATAVVAGNLDPVYFLFTGRASIRAFTADSYALFYAPPGQDRAPLGTVEAFRHRLLQSGVDYCIWSPDPGFSETPHYRRLLDDLREAYRGSVRIVAGEEASGYVVYAIDRARLAPGQDHSSGARPGPEERSLAHQEEHIARDDRRW